MSLLGFSDSQSEPIVDGSSNEDLPLSCYTKKPTNEAVRCIFSQENFPWAEGEKMSDVSNLQ